MKTISLKLDESILQDTDLIVEQTNLSRNRYINDALRYYNHLQKRRLLAEKIKAESLMVREDSMDVLYDFERMDDHDQTV